MSAPFDREKEIFDQALRLDLPEERKAFLRQACGHDEVLHAHLSALLESHEEADGFLPTKLAEASNSATKAQEGVGSQLGRYKLLQKIGEGGCGVVYMAEQQVPVRRRVALKVIKLGMDTKEIMARFEAERQALAMMEHANIAKVLDAGATESGRPYFVMELVRGVKVTDFCDQNNLGVEERLRLFLQICQAIQHAHQKGIIHRDIKPSNILVTVNDGEPVPKVIDFGIAKATTGQLLTDKTLFTAFEQFIGTPAYMSPEQAVMTSVDLDGRSDVYALGVLLYELLTGTTPFDAKQLLTAGLDEIRRTIREVEPLKPSTRLGSFGDADLTTVARVRSSPPDKLASLIRGELDWIVMKALEKDRRRRYQSAVDLAQDLRRHLAKEAVLARAPTLSYRLGKWALRHKTQLATAGAIGLVLFVAAVVVAFQSARAKRAEQLAAEQAALAKSARKYIEEEIPRLYQARLGETGREVPTPVAALAAPPYMRRILSNDGSVTEVPRHIVQQYLALNRTNAESLLAAQRAMGLTPELLSMMVENFSDHPHVLYTIVSLDRFPEERRKWIEHYKAAASDALPLYLSAWDYLRQGDQERALPELHAAAQRQELNDFAAQRIQATEEIYLQQGRSPAEAKAVATAGLTLPHLNPLRELVKELAALCEQQQLEGKGEGDLAETFAQLGVRLSRQVNAGNGSTFFVYQRVGLIMELEIMNKLAPDARLQWLGCSPAERTHQIQETVAQLDRLRERDDQWLASASEPEIVAYFDRIKLYGEAAASRWIDQRTNSVVP